MEFLLAAFTLGFLGSFHCIGMCGPIALALPLHRENRVRQLTGSVVYNLGRVFTYGLFGLVFGLLGKGFIIAGYQQALSIGLGVLVLLFFLMPTAYAQKFRLTKIIHGLISKIKSSLRLLLQRKSFAALFTIGLLNGFLPCGLVYLGVAGAIATGEAPKGSLFMMAFGVGTLPAMLLVTLASGWIGPEVRSKMRKAVPIFVVLMAIVLIMRGMNLGIPYLSPSLSHTDCTQHTCCHQ